MLTKKIPQILTAASTALQNLQPSGPAPLPAHIKVPEVADEESEDDSDEDDQPLAKPPNASEPSYGHKTAFLNCMRAYSDLVFSLQSSLFEQIDALQEAGIITAKGQDGDSAADGKEVKKADGKDAKDVKDGSSVSAGQLGGMDVGWLNERGRDTGRVFEAELMQETREHLEGLMAKSQDVRMEGT
jgi:hypothetical protein